MRLSIYAFLGAISTSLLLLYGWLLFGICVALGVAVGPPPLNIRPSMRVCCACLMQHAYLCCCSLHL